MYKILLFLCFILLPAQTFGQVVDMRSISRQRGYAGYQPRPRQVYHIPQRIKRQESIKKQAAKQEQTQPEAITPPLSEKEQKERSEEVRAYIYDNPEVQPDL